MTVDTYTKTGQKAPTKVKLADDIYGVEVADMELLKQSYLSYLAEGRSSSAKTKTRGEVRGGGRKPWKQKGTGRARFGSTRNPIWRGGGIAFGPTGIENYSLKINSKAKKTALKQALSLAAKENRIKVIDTFECKDGKVKNTIKLIEKLGSKGKVLLVVSAFDDLVDRATRNITDVKAVSAQALNVYDTINCDCLVISTKSLDILKGRLENTNTRTKAAKS